MKRFIRQAIWKEEEEAGQEGAVSSFGLADRPTTLTTPACHGRAAALVSRSTVASSSNPSHRVPSHPTP